MALLSVFNAPINHAFTDLASAWMPIIASEQNIWVSISTTGSSTFSENPAIGFTELSHNSELNEFIGFELSRVPEVTKIYAAFRASVFYVWIFLDSFETKIRERIYVREQAIIDEFSMFEFDFYLVAAEEQDSGAMLSGPVDLVYERC